MIVAHQGLRQTAWQWFSYHFNIGPRPFAISIMEACASINRHAAEVGTAHTPVEDCL